MKQSFDYAGDMVYAKSIDIDDTGNACLRAVDSNGCEYYLVMMTALGQTTSLEWGPLDPDAPILPDSVGIEFRRVDYSDYMAARAIRQFLMPRKVGKQRVDMEDVMTVSPKEALSHGVDMFDYMSNFGPTESY